jgi:nucleotide-binding universal stress UspA family protein
MSDRARTSERTIVVAYDGSPHSEDGLALAGVLSEVLAARPLVTTVVLYPDHLSSAEERQTIASEYARKTLEVGADRLRALDPRTRALGDDSPAHALNEIAEAEEPLMVVLGSTHRGPLGRVFLGSVGQSLLSGAPCAIAVAPRDYAQGDEHRLRRIGVALNGSEESWSAFSAALSLAERVHGELIAVAVAAPPHYGYEEAFAALTAAEYQSAEHRAAIKLLEQAESRVPAGVAFRATLREGLAERELAQAGEELDLLVVGSRGYGPIRRTLLGAVTSKLLHQATCPVLVLPRQAGDDPLHLRVRGLTQLEGLRS